MPSTAASTVDLAVAIDQQQVSDALAPDYRFARPDVAELTSALATKRKSATGGC